MTNKKKIIIFSGKQFSGKDTVAKILLEHFKSFKRIGIADAIKLQYSKKTGLSLEEIEKNKSIYRQDLIDLGNWGRNKDPDYWLNSILNYNCDIIVTDIRVKHELNLFRSFGAFCIRVEADKEVRSQRGILSSENDITETALDDINDWDFIVNNNGSYFKLQEEVKQLIDKINEYYDIK